MYKGVELPPIKEARGSNNDTDLHTNHRLTSHEALGDILKQKGTRGRTKQGGRRVTRLPPSKYEKGSLESEFGRLT